MRAAFFDLDGTLIDSRADLAATVNHTRRDLGLPEKSVEEVIAQVGRGARYLLTHAIPERAQDADELLKLFLGHYGEHMLDHCALYPGVVETLEELRSRGYLLGINTAKPAFATRAILEHFGLTDFFGEAVIAGGDCPEMKPSAAPLLACALRMGGHRVTPDDWMVGDNWTDMECARNAGVRGIFCDFGFGLLNDAPCDDRIRCFSELLSLSS